MSKQQLPRNIVKAEEWNWNENMDPPFHLKTAHPTVVKFHDRLFAGGERGRIFIPLCGKTLDMIYFADKGHSVVGVEFSEVAIESFFKENSLSYEKQSLEVEPFIEYRCNEKNIIIYKGDFFAMKKEICGQFDCIWDKGGFVAINVPDRSSYSAIVMSMMKPSSNYLLEALDYDGSTFAGPPHYTTPTHLEEFFGKRCTIEELDAILYSIVSLSHAVFTHIDYMRDGATIVMRDLQVQLKSWIEDAIRKSLVIHHPTRH